VQPWLVDMPPSRLATALFAVGVMLKLLCPGSEPPWLCPGMGGSAFVTKLLARVQPSLHQLLPKSLANMAWTLAMMGRRNDLFTSKLLLAATEQLCSFDEHSATAMTTAMAAMGNPNAEFMSDLLQTVDLHLCSFSPYSLAKMLVAVVSYCNTAVSGRSFVLKRVQLRRCMQLVDAIGGHPFLRVHEPFLSAWQVAATLQLPRFKDEDLVETVEALAMAASMSCFNSVFVDALVTVACPKVAGFVTTHISRFYTALLHIANVMESKSVSLEDHSHSFTACKYALEARMNGEAARRFLNECSLGILGD
jgi:hypothetical protein